jgi:hypothetical protein
MKFQKNSCKHSLRKVAHSTCTRGDTPRKKECQFVIKIVNNVCKPQYIKYIYMVDVQTTYNLQVIYTMTTNQLRVFVSIVCAYSGPNRYTGAGLKPSEIKVSLTF